MQRCAEKGLNLNPEKCNIKQQEIKFYGVICGNDGVKPNPKKVTALKQMSAPRNRQGLLSFLGLATYMSMFVQNLSGLSTTLREKTRKNVTFQWSDEHQEASEAIKEAVSADIAHNYFDPQKPITLQVDTSMAGLGAVLFQGDRPVAFASRALTYTESRYANIEREMLAVVFGCERFHNFLFGQDFIVESDHKTLESIHLKHLSSAPARLRRMLLRLQPYTMVIKYKPGREVAVADALSRLPVEDTNAIPNLEAQIHDVQSQFSTEILSPIKSETAKDVELNVLRKVIYTGWPEARSEAPSPSRPYWNYRDELSIEDGLIVKGESIVIPASMTKEILEKLHAAHQGREKMKLRARSAAFWNGINKDIDQTASHCTECQKAQPRQTREELEPTDIPPYAWHTVGADLFFLDNADYLIVPDYYSKYPFVYKLPSTESPTISRCLKSLFAEQGVPVILRSDNGPQFSSNGFRKFADEYGFRHVTSSPHYPWSNGFVESQVKIVKKSLAKAKKSGLDPALALLCLRITPIDGKSKSPAELLFGRQLQDNLPRRRARNAGEADHFEHLAAKQEQQKTYYDERARATPLSPVVPSQPVVIRNESTNKWEPAIVKSTDRHRSAIVETPQGKTLR